MTKAKDTKAGELERQRLTSLINSMADGVIAVNEQAKVVLYNGSALNILDINTNPANQPIDKVLKLLDKNNQELNVKKLVLDTKTQQVSRDWRMAYPGGETVNVYMSIAPVKLGYGTQGSGGFVILVRDITREKSLEEERDEFISVVSHELRTPIAITEGNIGNAEFIFEKSGTDSPGVKDALKQAHDQVNFLAGMMNDLSTLARAERGKLEVEVEAINAHDIVENLANTYKKSAANKGLTIRMEVDPKLEVFRSSRLYTGEILQNFVTNAIKYTEKGSVTIGARPKKSGVEFFVSDTGIGISKQDQEKVFDKFFRSEDFRTRQNSGTGLGLYVTMKLVRMIHAEIDVSSELNKGSTFTVFIPNLE